MLESSGGNALQTALTMCDQVDVYGVGLLSKGPESEKAYTHYYDESVGHCCTDRKSAQRSSQLKLLKGSGGWKRLWMAERIRSELLMNVLDAFGVMRWIQ